MASPLKPAAGGSFVDLTADDGDDEPEVVITGTSPRTTTNGARRRPSTAPDTSPEKQALDAVLQRSQQTLLSAQGSSSGASPTKPATAASRSASPSKPSPSVRVPGSRDLDSASSDSIRARMC